MEESSSVAAKDSTTNHLAYSFKGKDRKRNMTRRSNRSHSYNVHNRKRQNLLTPRYGTTALLPAIGKLGERDNIFKFLILIH